MMVWICSTTLPSISSGGSELHQRPPEGFPVSSLLDALSGASRSMTCWRMRTRRAGRSTSGVREDHRALAEVDPLCSSCPG
jgi:hypothetical protein